MADTRRLLAWDDDDDWKWRSRKKKNGCVRRIKEGLNRQKSVVNRIQLARNK